MATVVGPPALDRSLQMALMGFAQPIGQALAGQPGLKGQRGTFREIQDPETGKTVTALINPVTGQIISTFPSVPGGADPFTLGPGQQRFGPGGQVIAGVPETPDPFTLGPGQQRYGPGGGLLAQAPFGPYTLGPGEQRFGIGGTPLGPAMPDPFTLGPGQQRFGAGGQPIGAQVPFAPPKPLLPSQKISQKKLDEINRLQAKVDAGTITKPERAKLDKMLVGVPLVQIGLGKPPSPTERTAIAETRASIDALDNLKTLFDSAQTKVGIIPGRVEPIKGLFGMTTDEQEALMAATSAFKNRIIKEITGAQMSEVEAKRIMKQIPDITDPPKRWKAKWEQSKKNLTFLQRRRMEILRQTGLRVPEGRAISDINVPPATEPNTDAVYNKFGF